MATTLWWGQPAAQPQAQEDKLVYRYLDRLGRVVYSDLAPAPDADARDVQRIRVSKNMITTSEQPLVVQQAAERFPVTLFTFECGDSCDSAIAFLNRRGVPYESVNLHTADGQKKLQQVTGDNLFAPVLQVGDKMIVKGWNETRWNAILDQAGYPKAPASRAAPGKRSLTEPGDSKSGSKVENGVPTSRAK
ncbi:MAG TPA: hypothetical protein VNG69_16690 [Casimicrobiaceae bacterium]|nr:hypothetical protein [Casimicrobiaceae bacterium]